MGEINSTNTYNQLIHSIPANTKKQLPDININVQTYSGISLIDTVNEKKEVTKYFNRIQLNKNVEKKKRKLVGKQTCRMQI